jgi:hypothetical protein
VLCIVHAIFFQFAICTLVVYLHRFCPTVTTQTICPAGSFCPAGVTAATVCPAGSYAPMQGLTAAFGCPTCLEGNFCPNTATQSVCPAGQFCATGVTNGTFCRSGFYCPQGSFTGVACQEGQYCPVTGLSAYVPALATPSPSPSLIHPHSLACTHSKTSAHSR